MKPIDRLIRERTEELSKLNAEIKTARAKLRRLTKSIKSKQPQERCKDTADWVDESVNG